MSITLGIHIGHDGGAALVQDHDVLVACSEERLTGHKYANGWWNAVRYCLDHADVSLSQVDLVVISNAGPRMPANYDAGLPKWSSAPIRTHVVDHHLSHAFGAYALSGMRRALVFVGDAGGNDGVTETAYVFEGNSFESVPMANVHRPRCKGLGTTYEAFTNFLGFSDQESGKTMALAAFGDPFRWKADLFEIRESGEIVSDLRSPHHWGVKEWAARHGIDLGKEFPESTSETAKNLAALIQRSFEESLLQSIDILAGKYGLGAVVISGGIGLNCVANSKIRSARPNMEMYYFPVCSDAGLPLGNALYGQWITDKEIPCIGSQSLFLGRTYSNEDIQLALQRHPDTVPSGGLRLADLSCHKSRAAHTEAAEMIAEGKIVAWWQGRSELGPRALGARSILANPRTHNIREIVNQQIKEREWFRPFGPSILLEEIDDYVGVARPYPYMIEAPQVTEAGERALGDCVHVNKSARVQTVKSSDQPDYAKLLCSLKRITGNAVVLNTSFNIQGPIVETPGDAIATFLRSKLDALILGDYVCFRR